MAGLGKGAGGSEIPEECEQRGHMSTLGLYATFRCTFVLFESNEQSNNHSLLLITFLALNFLKAVQTDTCQVYKKPFPGVQAHS